MKVLITGHKGFVGRYFMERLADHDILGVDIKDGYDHYCRFHFKIYTAIKTDVLFPYAT